MQLDDSVRAIGEFAAAWLEPLFAFCTESLGSEWKDLRARGVASTLSDEDGAAGRQKGSNESTSVTDDMVHEKVVRDWTRAWSQQILGRLLASIGMWFPEAAQIENELASSSRVTAAAAPAKLAKHQQQGNRALGAYVLGAPSVLASALTASLGALKYNDTASASRVLAQLAVMAPSLLLVSLLPMYQPPTPAHASITSNYCARIQGSAPNAGDRCSDLFAWLAADLPNALVDVLRDASLVDLQDAALSLLADLAFTSAAVASRMPIHWSFRNSSGAADQRASAIPLTASIVPVGDPGLVYRQTVVRTMAPALQAAGVAAEEVDQTLTQLAASPAADTKHRRALLKIALQPLLAVEKSKLFSERDPKPAKPSAGRAALDGGLKHVAPASWTNKHDGQSTSVLDNDAQFDLGSLMP
ncbi:hypothetical protein LPJ61_006104 [Coemansia biformis]|uniref:Exportin-5 C-terminal domain-containing protein n=1 Tax=Coemansia biformis TaxID=1286918 RepID=A0A9W7XU95_9FUNG|nr:hypothetical protein LPJ61_006104 [Coemansia biformis]